MNFEVYLDDKLLYYPNDETYVITNSKLELALNEAGSFEFDVPQYNLRYDDFSLRKSMVRVLQNGDEIFYGEVREVTQNFDFTKHIYCVGELAFLFDSIQPQKVYKGSPYEMLKQMIAQHNAQVESRKQFDIGYVSVNDDYVYHFTNREDTLTAIREKLCNTLDGYLKIEKLNNKRKLSIVKLQNYGRYCQQEIQFGENLIDYSCNMSASDIATCVIPLGVRFEEAERTKDAVKGLDEYLTIKGTSTNAYHKHLDDDFVQIDSAIATFGNVRVVKKWDDVTDKDNLQKKAIDWLKSAQYSSMTLEMNAFDMNILDANIDTFDVGDTVHAWALPYGMDTTFPVQKKVIYINDLDKNTITLGQTMSQSYTKQASNAVAQAIEEIPAISPILQSAKDNALNMLNGSVGGHVIMAFDKDNKYVEQIMICNASTEKASTQKWVWNLNGFGYMYRKSTNDKWTDLDVAITMGGSIVANFITAGLLKLTGSVKNGDSKTGATHLEVYDGNVKIGSWSSDGISIDKGAIQLGYDTTAKDYKFKVDNGGSVTLKNGTIQSSNYSEPTDTSNGYSVSGTKIDLANGSINSQNFNIDSSGNASYNGNLSATQITSGAISADRIKTNVISAINDKANASVTINGARINIAGNTTFTAVQSTADTANSNASDAKSKTDGLSNGNTTINGGCIKTGTISANYIKGGTLTLGGKDGDTTNVNGVCSVKDEYNVEQVVLDKDGITAKKGYIGNGSSGWAIGAKDIHNGCDCIDSHSDGTYIGIDGIRNQTGNTFTKITGGQLYTNSVDIDGGSLNINSSFQVDTEGKITSTAGTIGGFTINDTNLHTGTNSDGVWITGDDTEGCPKGMVAVGTHGDGLIRIGYKHNGRIGILWEVNDSEQYFVDLYEIGTRI